MGALGLSLATSTLGSHWFSRVADEVLQSLAPPTLRQEQTLFGANGLGHCRLQVRPDEEPARPAGISGSQVSLPVWFRNVWSGVAGSECGPAKRLQLALDLSLAPDTCHRSGGPIHANPVASRTARCYIGQAIDAHGRQAPWPPFAGRRRCRMIRVVSWNVFKKWPPWRVLVKMAQRGEADVALFRRRGTRPPTWRSRFDAGAPNSGTGISTTAGRQSCGSQTGSGLRASVRLRCTVRGVIVNAD